MSIFYVCNFFGRFSDKKLDSCTCSFCTHKHNNFSRIFFTPRGAHFPLFLDDNFSVTVSTPNNLICSNVFYERVNSLIYHNISPFYIFPNIVIKLLATTIIPLCSSVTGFRVAGQGGGLGGDGARPLLRGRPPVGGKLQWPGRGCTSSSARTPT